MGSFDELARQLDEQAALIPIAEDEAKQALLGKIAEWEEIFRKSASVFQEYFKTVLKNRLRASLVLQHGSNLDQRTNRIVRDRIVLAMNVIPEPLPYGISSPFEAGFLKTGDIHLSDGTYPPFHPNVALQLRQDLVEHCDMKTGTWTDMEYTGLISVWGRPEGYKKDLPAPQGLELSVFDHGWDRIGTTVFFASGDKPSKVANTADNLRSALIMVTPNVFQHKDIIRGTSSLR